MIPATFLARPNRFVALVATESGETLKVHVASSGRMADLLVEGAPVMVKLNDTDKPGRVTAGLLAMVQTAAGTWVSADTALPGKLLRAALPAQALPPFAGYSQVAAEVPYGESRIDFRLDEPGLPPCLLEVKSVTTALPDPDGTLVARFPDAPTERGAKHLRELVRALSEGYRAAVLFVAQRSDVQAVGPYDAIDPAFGEELRAASRAGVELRAWRLSVGPAGALLDRELPVRL